MKKFFTFILISLALVGCGKKGKLEFPEGRTYPRQYPQEKHPVSSASVTPNNDISKETPNVPVP